MCSARLGTVQAPGTAAVPSPPGLGTAAAQTQDEAPAAVTAGPSRAAAGRTPEVHTPTKHPQQSRQQTTSHLPAPFSLSLTLTTAELLSDPWHDQHNRAPAPPSPAACIMRCTLPQLGDLPTNNKPNQQHSSCNHQLTHNLLPKRQQKHFNKPTQPPRLPRNCCAVH
jgi:hypothetical protein